MLIKKLIIVGIDYLIFFRAHAMLHCVRA